MKRTPISITKYFVIILLLIAIGLTLFACSWKNPTPASSTDRERETVSPEEEEAIAKEEENKTPSETVDPTPAPSEESKSQEAEPPSGEQTLEESTEDIDGKSPEEEPTATEEPPTEEEEETPTEDLEEPSSELPSDEEDPADSEIPASNPQEEDSEEEASVDYTQYYDLTSSYLLVGNPSDRTLYRYRYYEKTDLRYEVWIELETHGTATLSAEGILTFENYPYSDEECELWAPYDEAGPTAYFLYFPTLGEYREIRFRDDLVPPVAQLDIPLSELDHFARIDPEPQTTDPEPTLEMQIPEQQTIDPDPTPEPQTPEIADPPAEDPQGAGEEPPVDPKCALCGMAMTAGSSHETTCIKYAALPADSAAEAFLGEFSGVWEDWSESVYEDEEESDLNVQVTLSYVTEEGLSDLKGKLTLLSSTGWISDKNYSAKDLAFGDAVCSLDASVEKSGNEYCVTFRLKSVVLK